MAKYYYNDVLLPEIPVVDGKPYVWIRDDGNGSNYEAIYCAYPWHRIDDKMYPRKSANYVAYYIASDLTEWTYKNSWTNNTGYWYGVGAIWSSHDIPDGSASASEIYLYASEPVPEGGSEPEPEYKEKYAVTSEWLVSVADEVRRLTGSTDKLTTEQILEALRSANA